MLNHFRGIQIEPSFPLQSFSFYCTLVFCWETQLGEKRLEYCIWLQSHSQISLHCPLLFVLLWVLLCVFLSLLEFNTLLQFFLLSIIVDLLCSDAESDT